MSKTTTSPMLWLPSAGDGIQLTPSGTAWTNASYTELTSSAPTDLYPALLAVLPNNGATVAELSAEFDIAVGAAGSELPLITVRARVMADQWGPTGTIPLGVIFNKINAGQRVALRVRHGATANTNVYRVALGYFQALGGATGYSTHSPSITPSGSSSVTITAGGSAWTFGSWQEIMPAVSVTANLLITGILVVGASVHHELQIGFGASGSEVAKATIPWGVNAGSVGIKYLRLPRPLYVPLGTRIAMRTRSGTASATFFGTIWHVAA